MKKHIESQVKKRLKGEARKKIQQDIAEINEKGQEVCDPQPLFHNVGFKEPPSINDRIRQITMEVQAETAAKMAAQNLTKEEVKRILDEEDDFDIPEDFEVNLTSYELAGQVAELQDDPYLEPETQPAPPAEQEPALAGDGVTPQE
jgi:hypothetical protein